ncbi:12S seed storage protein CRC-like [Euphorbia lathyris]|uniref:12S seed storage protein CRC-like n=1 Tax=Euphorbia lathyris TaxID=212925 RepID=UPI003313A284
MAYFSISLSCLLPFLFLHSCSCFFTECQEIDGLIAREPDFYRPTETGFAEVWDPNTDYFQCAGVQVTRYTILPDRRGLPFYNNADEMSYVVQGKALFGLIIPECSQKLDGGTTECQQITRIQSGDVFVFRAGEVAWFYNDGNENYVAVVITRLPIPDRRRNFEIGGSQNILGGFSSEFITKAFNINNELATKIRNNTDLRGRTDGGLYSSSSPTTQLCQKQDQQERNGPYNGKDKFFCNINTRIAKMSDPSSADLFIPQVGHLTTIDVHQIPILESSELSASYTLLLKDAMRLPHYENNYSMIYVVKGEGLIEVVDDNGNNVFDDIVKEGQLLLVPKYYVLSEQAKCGRFEYVTFKTNANPTTSDLSGRNSVINCLALEVLTNTFRINKEEAKNLKFGRKETSLVKISYDDICEEEST